ncbi:MAG: PA2169 family four-helix-bundle protein [Burkholderiales bacterium]
MENDVIIDILKDLIGKCNDGEYGFRICADHVRNRHLGWLLNHCADECAAAAADLQRMVEQTGGTAESGDSASGALHRGWVAVESRLVTYTDLALIEECESGERAALERYRDALEEPLPALMREAIRKQCEGVDRNLARVRFAGRECARRLEILSALTH